MNGYPLVKLARWAVIARNGKRQTFSNDASEALVRDADFSPRRNDGKYCGFKSGPTAGYSYEGLCSAEE